MTYDERRFRQARRRIAPARTAYNARRIVVESAPLLALLVLVQVAAGQILHAQSARLFDVPVLLLLIPAINGVGGNIGSVLGARLASGLHLGTIPSNLRGPTIWLNVRTSIFIAAVTYVVLAILVRIMTDYFGVQVSLTPLTLFAVILGAGSLLTLSLILITVAAARFSFSRGLDPDNHVIPVVTSSGDLIGVIALLTTYGLVVA